MGTPEHGPEPLTEPSREETKKIENEEIEELREPIKNLLEQMRPKIDSAEYSLLIGDDASGRIPTLIFRKIFKELYQDSGEKTPETIFIAGSGAGYYNEEDQKQAIPEKIQAINELLKKHAPKKKILIITDFIVSGSSIRPLLQTLHDLNYPFDVAAISMAQPQQTDAISKNFNCQIYGGDAKHSPKIYQNPYLTGISKLHTDLHATPYKPKLVSKPHLQPVLAQIMHEARKDATILAEELTDWYQKNK